MKAFAQMTVVPGEAAIIASAVVWIPRYEIGFDTRSIPFRRRGLPPFKKPGCQVEEDLRIECFDKIGGGSQSLFATKRRQFDDSRSGQFKSRDKVSDFRRRLLRVPVRFKRGGQAGLGREESWVDSPARSGNRNRTVESRKPIGQLVHQLPPKCSGAVSVHPAADPPTPGRCPLAMLVFSTGIVHQINNKPATSRAIPAPSTIAAFLADHRPSAASHNK